MPILHWWLDYDHRPSGSDAAQAVWLHGQWFFVPFALGVPLKRLCSLIVEADKIVEDYLGASDTVRAEAEMDLMEPDTAAGPDSKVYSLHGFLGPFLVVDRTDHVSREFHMHLDDALAAQVGLTATSRRGFKP